MGNVIFMFVGLVRTSVAHRKQLVSSFKVIHALLSISDIDFYHNMCYSNISQVVHNSGQIDIISVVPSL